MNEPDETLIRIYYCLQCGNVMRIAAADAWAKTIRCNECTSDAVIVNREVKFPEK